MVETLQNAVSKMTPDLAGTFTTQRSPATSLEVGHGASTTGRISKAAGAIGEACEEGGVEQNALGAMGSRWFKA